MKKLMQRGAFALTALMAVFVMGFGVVAAQNNTNNAPANGFRISPVRSEYTIDKGKKATLTITLENPSSSPTVGHPIVNDFVAADDETGEPRLLLDANAQTPKNSFKSLVTGLEDVTLGPNEKKDIAVTIAVPADAGAGGYYGAVRYVPQAAGDVGQNNVGLTASVGTIVLVRVPGNLTEKLDLVQLTGAVKDSKGNYNAKTFFTSGSVSIMTRLKNSGDIHVQPLGKVVIKNMFGKEVEKFEFNNSDPRANILPDSTRKFGNDLQNKKWFGRYTIEANLGYGQGGGGVLTAKGTFWYIPAWALYAMIVAILAIVGAIYWGVRKFQAKRQHKHDVNKQKSKE